MRKTEQNTNRGRGERFVRERKWVIIYCLEFVQKKAVSLMDPLCFSLQNISDIPCQATGKGGRVFQFPNSCTDISWRLKVDSMCRRPSKQDTGRAHTCCRGPWTLTGCFWFLIFKNWIWKQETMTWIQFNIRTCKFWNIYFKSSNNKAPIGDRLLFLIISQLAYNSIIFL